MFALEIEFNDGVSLSETLLLSRLSNLLGSSSNAHLEIEGSNETIPSIKIIRKLAREFSYSFAESGNYFVDKGQLVNGVGEIVLESYRLFITALDSDLLVKNDEKIDAASKRILESALFKEPPKFPAMVICSQNNGVCSLSENERYGIGRSRSMAIRIDDQSVSEEHAILSIEDGKFYIEDLNSKNGTFINDKKVSAKKEITTSDKIVLGLRTEIKLVDSAEKVEELSFSDDKDNLSYHQDSPLIISASHLVQPPQYLFTSDKTIRIGRDPTCEIWVGAPHISRLHAEVRLNKEGRFELIDYSTNGMTLNAKKVPRDVWLDLKGFSELDLGEEIILYLSQDKADSERVFKILEENGKALDLGKFSSYSTNLSNLAATSSKLASQYGSKFDEKSLRQKTTILSENDFKTYDSSSISALVYAILVLLFFTSAVIVLFQMYVF